MSIDAMKQALEALERGETKLRYQAIEALRAAIEQAQRNEFNPDWDQVEALRESLREHMAEIQRLRAVIEQAQPNARTLHKMMLAMMKEHWRSIDPQWKDDPELCHALGYEAGYNDAVARRVEPRASGSGAGFESLPASPQWQGLTDEEIWDEWCKQTKPERDTRNFVAAFALAIEAKLKEKNT